MSKRPEDMTDEELMREIEWAYLSATYGLEED